MPIPVRAGGRSAVGSLGATLVAGHFDACLLIKSVFGGILPVEGDCMSNDLAADWLLHGVAAAKAGEKEEARDLLEHALVELDVMAEVYGMIDTEAREIG